MNIHDILESIESLSLAASIRENDVLFPWIESVHVLAVVTVVGVISLVDLRLVGVPSHHLSIRRVMRELLPLAWGAFLIAALTGSLLFASHALAYSQKLPFLIKMALLLAAGANMALFHLVTFRSVESWDEALVTPLGARLAGALSLCLWIGIVVCGRWIGFVDA
jgi:hypothetical protein